jgi:hypothetical protein
MQQRLPGQIQAARSLLGLGQNASLQISHCNGLEILERFGRFVSVALNDFAKRRD